MESIQKQIYLDIQKIIKNDELYSKISELYENRENNLWCIIKRERVYYSLINNKGQIIKDCFSFRFGIKSLIYMIRKNYKIPKAEATKLAMSKEAALDIKEKYMKQLKIQIIYTMINNGINLKDINSFIIYDDVNRNISIQIIN